LFFVLLVLMQRLLNTILTFCLFFFVLVEAKAQIKVETPSFDLGEVNSGENGGAFHDFVFENTSNKDVFILRAEGTPNASILFSSKTIKAGETVFIRIKYISARPGRFMLNVPVYVSSAADPIVITLKGETKYTDNSVSQACPSFSSVAYAKKKSASIFIEVLDAETSAPIEDVRIDIYNSPWQINTVKTNRRGVYENKIETLGVHFIELSKKGYAPLNTQENMRLADNRFVYKLSKEVVLPKLTEELSVLVKDKQTLQPIVGAEVRVKIGSEIIHMGITDVKGGYFYPNFQKDQSYALDVVKETYSGLFDYTLSDFDLQDNVVTLYLDVRKEFRDSVLEKPFLVQEMEADSEVLDPNLYALNNIVFLIDRSTSMKLQGRLDLLKTAMYALLQPLRAGDKIALIAFDSKVEVLLPSTSTALKEEIAEVIFELETTGLTAGVSGIEMAFDLARAAYIPGGNNEVIVVTDGAFNVGAKQEVLQPRIINEAAGGIRMSVVGVKTSSVIEENLQEMAQMGNGSFASIKTKEDARVKVLELIKEHALKR
jgi:Ca-activated chloride channel family protein